MHPLGPHASRQPIPLQHVLSDGSQYSPEVKHRLNREPRPWSCGLEGIAAARRGVKVAKTRRIRLKRILGARDNCKFGIVEVVTTTGCQDSVYIPRVHQLLLKFFLR